MNGRRRRRQTFNRSVSRFYLLNKIKILRAATRVTRSKIYFFIIWLSQQKTLAPKHQIYKSTFKIVPNPKSTLNMLPNQLKFWPKWRNFAKSDHTGCRPQTKLYTWGAAIAQRIRNCLPSCRPRFKSQAQHQHFFQFMFDLCHVEKTKINKRGRDLPILLEKNLYTSFSS